MSKVAALFAMILAMSMLRAPVSPGANPERFYPAGTVNFNVKDGLPYVWIPAGSYRMGCSPGDTECLPSEMPALVKEIRRR